MTPSSLSWISSRSMSELLPGGVFDHELVEERSGFVSVLFHGKGARALYKDEAGGHRWQRIPPTEKRGRVQTSTVTVAVLDPEVEQCFELDPKDVEIQTTRGSGPGGQARNKIESCVVATHKATGVRVRVDMRSQYQSKSMALKILAAKLKESSQWQSRVERDASRKQQMGSGMRGDKVRTYRTQDDRVTDHRSDQTWSLKKWARGDWD